jgi:hypothetical protein
MQIFTHRVSVGARDALWLSRGLSVMLVPLDLIVTAALRGGRNNHRASDQKRDFHNLRLFRDGFVGPVGGLEATRLAAYSMGGVFTRH